MKLSVIIVSYNVKYYLDQCIRSVLRAFEVMQGDNASSSSSSSGEKDVAEIIVVDNHSSETLLEIAARKNPERDYRKLSRMLERNVLQHVIHQESMKKRKTEQRSVTYQIVLDISQC